MDRHNYFAAITTLTLAVSSVGCQLDRSSFQIDSNSRVPFLGFQLSKDDSKPVEESNGVTMVSAETEDASALPTLFRRTRQSTRIPLPRTDIESDVEPAADDAAE